jgi:hypothetical protein
MNCDSSNRHVGRSCHSIHTVRLAAVALLAIVLAGAATGCGEGGTLVVINDWPVTLYPPTIPLIIDGIHVLDHNPDFPPQLVSLTYNYLGPSKTLLPTESWTVFLVPGVYDVFATAPDPEILDCQRIYSVYAVPLANTGHATFTITDATTFIYFGDGCPAAE